jgi:hypothetical protein
MLVAKTGLVTTPFFMILIFRAKRAVLVQCNRITHLNNSGNLNCLSHLRRKVLQFSVEHVVDCPGNDHGFDHNSIKKSPNCLIGDTIALSIKR